MSVQAILTGQMAKNGIPTKEISAEDYNNLSEAQKMEDVVYLIPDEENGVSGNYVKLDEEGKIPDTMLPEMDYVGSDERGVANGVATLGTDGKLTSDQLPEITPASIGAATVSAPVICTFLATGWVQNASTNVWEQSVACAGLLATDDQRTWVTLVGSDDAAAQETAATAYGKADYAACKTDGFLYLRCPKEKPTADFSVSVTVIRG